MSIYKYVQIGLLAVFLSSPIFATNGANLIGLTPVSTGLGGVGIAYHTGVESLLKNPALLSYQERPTLLIGGNFVSLDTQARVSYAGTPMTADTGYKKSEATTFLIPEFAYAGPLLKDWSYGIGLFGVSGFGLDHRNQTEGQHVLANMRSHLMVLKFVPGVSYKNGPLSLGISTPIAYSQMNFSALLPDATGDPDTVQQRGGGLSDSISLGIQGGIGYEINQYVSLGATYQGPTAAEFKRLFDFDRNGTYDDITFELPAELGVGVAADLEAWDLSADVKQIFWSNAKGFKELKWKDQTVFALGAQYRVDGNLDLRIGYNYAPSVIGNTSSLGAANGMSQFGTGQFFDSNLAFFNTVGLGGVVGEQSVTLGAGYRVNDAFRVDGALQFGLGNTVTQSGKTTLATPDDTEASYTTKAETLITTVAATWTF